MPFAVAVDAGGTSTRCVVVESGGRCLGYAKTGSGNPVSGGVDLAAASVGRSVSKALERSGVPGQAVEAVIFSMAGALVEGQMDSFVESLRRLGVERHPVLKGDLLGSFCSGTPQLDGYALVCGTGAGAARIVDGEMVAVHDSMGWLIGDNGSGFWIGSRVVRAAFADLDGRGPHTALTGLLLNRLGLTRSDRRVEGGRSETEVRAMQMIYAMRPVEMSKFAGLAFEADDEVAREIVDQAAEELAQTLLSVATDITGPVVLAGGVICNQPGLAAAVQKLAKSMPATEFRVVKDGTVGAAVLSLRELGETVGRGEFDTIVGSLAKIRADEPG